MSHLHPSTDESAECANGCDRPSPRGCVGPTGCRCACHRLADITHTPGPWIITEYYAESAGVICVEHPMYEALDVTTPQWARSFVEHQANARLVSAAPELLEACIAALELLEEFVQGAERTHAQLHAAIAKARE